MSEPEHCITVHPIGDAAPTRVPCVPPRGAADFDIKASAFLDALPGLAASLRPVCDYCKTPYLTARPVGCRHCGAPAK